MMVFWTGVAAGVVAGAPFGALLVCIMVAAGRPSPQLSTETFRSRRVGDAGKLEPSNAATAEVSCM